MTPDHVTITLTGKDASGKVVAEETVHKAMVVPDSQM